MRFYKVTWRDEAAPEGHSGDYFTTKKEATKAVNDRKRSYKQELREWKATPEDEPWPGDRPTEPEVEIETLEFTGTVKKMMMAALQEQIIPY